MVSTHREKACSAEDDRTQHADAPQGERDFYFEDEVEAAEQARSRYARESGGCFCIPSSIRRRNGIGNVDSKMRRVAAVEHRAAEEELSQLNCTRNRALQIELVGLCKLVAPVDKLLQRHMRITRPRTNCWSVCRSTTRNASQTVASVLPVCRSG
jgi:hypothetical protein